MAVFYDNCYSKSMTFALSWVIEGEQQLLRNLRGVKEGMGNWKPAFRKTARELKKVFANDVFATKGKAIDEDWPPLKPAYLAKKRADGYSATPLIKTGKMQKAFRTQFDANSATIWNAIKYAKYHQSNKARSSNLPRRAMMKIGNDQKTMIVKIFHTHFIKKLKRVV